MFFSRYITNKQINLQLCGELIDRDNNMPGKWVLLSRIQAEISLEDDSVKQ